MERIINGNFGNFFACPEKVNDNELFNNGLVENVFSGVRKDIKTHVVPLKLSNKLNSEIVSDLIVKNFVKQLNLSGVASKVGRGDNDADFYIQDVPYEVKVSMGKSWRGGEFSKRAANYILIVRNSSLIDLRFLAILTQLGINDWKSSGNANYYATELKLADVLTKHHSIVYGDVKKDKIIFE